MRYATLINGCTCDPGCYPEGDTDGRQKGLRQYCPVHGDEVARLCFNHLKRCVERQMKETGVVMIPRNATQQELSDILDAGMEVVREMQQSLGGTE